MGTNYAVEINDVSKMFKLYHENVRSLKEKVLFFNKRGFEEFWALKDIDIKVKPGETLGIIGANGSGKSTLLKCITKILYPTSGKVITSGSIAALLELGAGFQPDLTGRENVYLNASILGFSKKEVDRKFDEIVAFAELERFIDNHVRNYSSGMHVRLGFAVAISVDPDILLIDEVLAVGDEAFQRKCIERIEEIQESGRTIVFVTHNVEITKEICTQVVMLDHGIVVREGKPREVVNHYHQLMETADEGSERGDRRLEILGVALLNEAEEPTTLALDEDDILNFPRGPGAGNCMHAVFERVDFTDVTTWPAAISAALREHPQGQGGDADAGPLPQMLTRMLSDVLRTRLPAGMTLSEVPRERSAPGDLAHPGQSNLARRGRYPFT